jgi:sugar phosphate permease
VARRGLTLGILNSASSTGQLIFLPLLMVVIVTSGWRAGSLFLAAFALCLIPFVAAWMRNAPADVGLAPYGSGEADPLLHGGPPPSDASTAVPLSEVFKSPTFRLLAGSFFVCGGTSSGLIGTHLIPHSIDYGIPAVSAAAIVGVMGSLNFVGTVLSGWLVDRIDPRRLLSLVYALRGVSLFILPFVTDLRGLFLFAVIYGLDWFATVPPTIALTADTFGTRSVATIYGWVFLSHQVGAALAASGSGAIRVWLGDYQFAFLAGGLMAMVAAVLALRIPPRGRVVGLGPVSGEVASA